MLVLGSTQRVALVNQHQVASRHIDAVRRRGGGGAVLLTVGDHLWIDAWVPRADPLWTADVSEAAARIGGWWRAALARLGVEDLAVHEGRADPGTYGELVCFAGKGPGELFHQGRKVMGLSQWRSREGTLFSTCAYTRWEPGPLLSLIRMGDAVRAELVRDLLPVAIGLTDIEPIGLVDLATLKDVLLASFPGWGSDDTSLTP